MLAEIHDIGEEVMTHPVFVEVLNLMGDFKVTEAKWPTDVYLTEDDEISLYTLTTNDVGNDLIKSLVLNGVRTTFGTLFGLKTHWDATETCVRVTC